MPGSEPVQALARGLDMLLAVARSEDGLRLNELAEHMGLGASTTHNLVKTMRLKGFVEKSQEGKLRPGAALREIAGRGANDTFERKVAAGLLALARRFPEAVLTYSEIAGSEIAVVMRMSPDMSGALQRPSGRLFQLYYNVSALLYLAFAAEETVEWLRLNHPFGEEGLAHWGDERKLEDYLLSARRAGHAESPFIEAGILRLAVPVFGLDGGMRGTLGASVATRGAVLRETLLEALLAAAGGVRA